MKIMDKKQQNTLLLIVCIFKYNLNKTDILSEHFVDGDYRQFYPDVSGQDHQEPMVIHVLFMADSKCITPSISGTHVTLQIKQYHHLRN